MAYQPIGNYAMIGDMHTVALVGINGSIDWVCIPHLSGTRYHVERPRKKLDGQGT